MLVSPCPRKTHSPPILCSIVEIYGPEASGKTTVALQCVAQCQRAGGTAVFVDAEHALDAAYCERLGVDLNSLLVSQPDHGEQALGIVETLASLYRVAGSRIYAALPHSHPIHLTASGSERHGGHGRSGQCGGPGAQGGAGGGYGRLPHCPSGKAHEPGLAEAHRWVPSVSCHLATS
jgi:hypothetical protein